MLFIRDTHSMIIHNPFSLLNQFIKPSASRIMETLSRCHKCKKHIYHRKSAIFIAPAGLDNIYGRFYYPVLLAYFSVCIISSLLFVQTDHQMNIFNIFFTLLHQSKSRRTYSDKLVLRVNVYTRCY
jgi:hypothetical protein